MENKTDNQIYTDIVEEVKRIIYFNQVERAFEFQQKIDQYIKKKGLLKKDKELYKKYQRIVIKLKWVSLSYFNKQEIIDLFENYLKAAFEIPDFDLWEKLKLFLLQFGDFEERDEIKKDIINVLNSGKARITSKNINEKKEPTVKNWIREYITTVGVGRAESIKLQKFFTQNKNFTTLPANEKNKIKDFFKFYERIKLSSLTPEGVEDSIEIMTDDFRGVFHDGKLEEHEKLTDYQKKLLDISIKIIDGEDVLKETNIEGSGEDVLEDEKIKKLKEEMKKYPEGSFEKMMIEEEIGKNKKQRTKNKEQ